MQGDWRRAIERLTPSHRGDCGHFDKLSDHASFLPLTGFFEIPNTCITSNDRACLPLGGSRKPFADPSTLRRAQGADRGNVRGRLHWDWAHVNPPAARQRAGGLAMSASPQRGSDGEVAARRQLAQTNSLRYENAGNAQGAFAQRRVEALVLRPFDKLKAPAWDPQPARLRALRQAQ